MSRHRMDRKVRTAALPLRFEPKHCAGTGCLHNHHGDDAPRIRPFGWGGQLGRRGRAA